jgi:hypothetical protein
LRRVVRYGLFALLAGSVLPFGGVEPWAVATIEVGAGALAALALFAVSSDGSLFPRRARLVFALALVLVGIGIVQLLPLPPVLGSLVPAPTLEARDAVGSLLGSAGARTTSTSLDRSETVDAVLRLFAYVCIGFAGAVAVRRPAERRQAGLFIVALATFEAAYGAAEYLSGHQHIFGYAKRFYLEEATGTFINRNHFAGFLAMALPFAVAFFQSEERERTSPPAWRRRLLNLARPTSLRRVLAGFCIALIWCGVLLSYSRAGLAVSLVSALAASAVSQRRRRAIWLLTLTLSVPLLVMLWHDVRPPAERLGELGGDVQARGGRLAVWRATLEMVPSYGLVGSGLGTFEEVFAIHEPAEITRHYDHAHNDWLQCLLEGGYGALLVCLSIVFATFYPTRAGPGVRLRDRVHAIAPLAGLIAIALHSLVDFSLRIPAVAVLASVLVGLAVTRGEDLEGEVGPKSSSTWFAGRSNEGRRTRPSTARERLQASPRARPASRGSRSEASGRCSRGRRECRASMSIARR